MSASSIQDRSCVTDFSRLLGLFGKWKLLLQVRVTFLDSSMLFRVYLEAPILRVRFVIADLPGKSFSHSDFSSINGHLGLQGTNIARVKAARISYQMWPHIRVADISRALTDQSLKTSLDSAISHSASLSGSMGKGLRIAVICTNQRSVFSERKDVTSLIIKRWSVSKRLEENFEALNPTSRLLGSKDWTPQSRKLPVKPTSRNRCGCKYNTSPRCRVIFTTYRIGGRCSSLKAETDTWKEDSRTCTKIVLTETWKSFVCQTSITKSGFVNRKVSWIEVCVL